MSGVGRAAALSGCLAIAALAVMAFAPDQGAALASAGVYGPAQAERGQALFAARCVACHGPAMAGKGEAPPLAGPRFVANWAGRPAAQLFLKIRFGMPQDDPGTLTPAQAADLMAALLRANGYPPGATLPADAGPLQSVRIGRPPAR